MQINTRLVTATSNKLNSWQTGYYSFFCLHLKGFKSCTVQAEVCLIKQCQCIFIIGVARKKWVEWWSVVYPVPKTQQFCANLMWGAQLLRGYASGDGHHHMHLSTSFDLSKGLKNDLEPNNQGLGLSPTWQNSGWHQVKIFWNKCSHISLILGVKDMDSTPTIFPKSQWISRI